MASNSIHIVATPLRTNANDNTSSSKHGLKSISDDYSQKIRKNIHNSITNQMRHQTFQTNLINNIRSTITNDSIHNRIRNTTNTNSFPNDTPNHDNYDKTRSNINSSNIINRSRNTYFEYALILIPIAIVVVTTMPRTIPLSMASGPFCFRSRVSIPFGSRFRFPTFYIQLCRYGDFRAQMSFRSRMESSISKDIRKHVFCKFLT